MKLLYACTDPGIPVDGGKGASIHVRALCRALAAEGHAVALAAARLDGPPDRLAVVLRGAVAALGPAAARSGRTWPPARWPRPRRRWPRAASTPSTSASACSAPAAAPPPAPWACRTWSR